MKINYSFLLAMLVISSFPAFAEEGSVNIIFPKDGATLNGQNENKLSYEVVPGPNGDHVHVYVDNNEDVVRILKGDYTLPKLSPGEHTIAIKVVNKNHTPIGVEKSIKVTAN